jgi:flagellar biosynthesis protein FlhA
MPSWSDRFNDAVRTGFATPVLVLAMLFMVMIPLHPVVLDIFFSFNIALAIVVMLTVVYAARPLEFSVFPTVLLVATLLRLSLNVASTRVVLLDGHTGTGAAGRVIEAFGSFVIGGNYAVGIVVFAILVIINFVVVTKGAGRISEVSARFTLDAMPGKQMAIDADLNAGVITQEDAKTRRSEVAQEADFYGAMDGASKFVRGDAVAGILILLINLLGGLAIGLAQHDLTLAEAVQFYALLTIGDGLVAQIPSLLLSAAAAIIVTRVSASHDLGQRVQHQLFGNRRVVDVTAIIVGALGLLPGMPNFAFLSLAIGLGAFSWYLHRGEPEEETSEVVEEPTVDAPALEVSWDDVAEPDRLQLEIGYRLIPLVSDSHGGELVNKVKSVRKRLTTELGFLVPMVHIRDDLELESNSYRLLAQGVVVGEGEIYPGMQLAMDPSGSAPSLQGVSARDPVYGLDAIWIDDATRAQAESLGYMVVDGASVITTHLDKVVRDFAHEMLSHNDTQQLLDRVAERSPKLVQELVPEKLSIGTVTRVFQNLLLEGVPLTRATSVVETLAEHAEKSQDPDVLTAKVRETLGKFIVQQINGLREELQVVVLDAGLDRLLHQSIQTANQAGGSGRPGVDANTLRALEEGLGSTSEQLKRSAEPIVVLTADEIRPLVSQIARRIDSELRVLAIAEIPDNQNLRAVERIGAMATTPDSGESLDAPVPVGAPA